MNFFLQEAHRSLRFYRNLSDSENDCATLQQVMSTLKTVIGSQSAKTEKNTLNWSELLKNPTRKAFIIGIVLALLCRWCGCVTMISHAGYIFKEAGSSMAPNTAAIVVAALQLIGSYMATILVDRAGRKVIASCHISKFSLFFQSRFVNYFRISLDIVYNFDHWNGTGFGYIRCIHVDEILGLWTRRLQLDSACEFFVWNCHCIDSCFEFDIFVDCRNNARKMEKCWRFILRCTCLVHGICHNKMFTIFNRCTWLPWMYVLIYWSVHV